MYFNEFNHALKFTFKVKAIVSFKIVRYLLIKYVANIVKSEANLGYVFDKINFERKEETKNVVLI